MLITYFQTPHDGVLCQRTFDILRFKNCMFENSNFTRWLVRYNNGQVERICRKRERESLGARRVKRAEIVVPTFYSGYRILTVAEDVRCEKAAVLDAFFHRFFGA